MEIIRTDSSNQDFIALVKSLDKYLSVTDGDEHAFYDQYNKLDNIKYVVLAYQNNPQRIRIMGKPTRRH